jgi:hypothetical protein
MHKSFVIYHDLNEVLECLDDEQAGKLFKAIMAYSVTGECIDLDKTLKLAFLPVKQAMDRDRDKWTATKERRAMAGRAGGLARASNARQTQAKPGKAKQSQAKQAVNENVNVNVNVNESVNVNHTCDLEHRQMNQSGSDIFEKLWSIWEKPKRGNLGAAQMAFLDELDWEDAEEMERFELAFLWYCKSQEVQKGYIKKTANWLREWRNWYEGAIENKFTTNQKGVFK